jgi:hypothetical protein
MKHNIATFLTLFFLLTLCFEAAAQTSAPFTSRSESTTTQEFESGPALSTKGNSAQENAPKVSNEQRNEPTGEKDTRTWRDMWDEKRNEQDAQGLKARMPAPSNTATPLSTEQANNFYAHCASNNDPRMSQSTQEAMCACNAVMMQRHMSVEDVQLMVSDTQESRLALNKMLLEVYAPCMNYPVNDLILGECLQNPQLDNATTSKDALCLCMAERTAAWFLDEGRNLMGRLIAENPNITDPISPVMESRPFKNAAMQSLTSCMGGL